VVSHKKSDNLVGKRTWLLSSPPDIYAFAQNGMTSAEMLQRTYLRFIEEEATAKRARAQIRPGDLSMVKRVGVKA
jgi:hypothetical protein